MSNAVTSNTVQSTENERSLLPLLSLAENSAYSAKNHFKSADVMIIPRYAINTLTTVSLFSIAIPYFQPYSLELQTFAVVASILNLLLIAGLLSPERESKYKNVGDSYLKLYRECFALYTASTSIADKRIEAEKLQNKYDRMDRYYIGFVSRRLSKWSLEHENHNDDELDLEWLRSEKRRLANG